MHFKLEFTVRGLLLGAGRNVDFNFAGTHAISVRLWSPTSAEQGVHFKQGDAFGSATSQREPNSKVNAMFVHLAGGDLPPGSEIDTTWLDKVYDEHGHLLPGETPPAHVLPEPFQSFIRDVTGELWDYARRTVYVLRWRCRAGGQHNPFTHRDMLWSQDGTEWTRLPGFFSISLSDSRGVPSLSKSIHEEVQSLVQAGNTEPLGHELYQEAWEQRYSNPRSALVLGIAAAEAGFKQFVGTIVPDARWLAENAPSPPLVKMLAEYLPKLPARNTFAGKVPPPPPDILNTLKKGVESEKTNSVTEGLQV